MHPVRNRSYFPGGHAGLMGATPLLFRNEIEPGHAIINLLILLSIVSCTHRHQRADANHTATPTFTPHPMFIVFCTAVPARQANIDRPDHDQTQLGRSRPLPALITDIAGRAINAQTPRHHTPPCRRQNTAIELLVWNPVEGRPLSDSATTSQLATTGNRTIVSILCANRGRHARRNVAQREQAPAQSAFKGAHETVLPQYVPDTSTAFPSPSPPPRGLRLRAAAAG